MNLKSLRVEQFRCIELADLAPDESQNLIIGPNASGKTSLLEAIFFLGRGRSFRARGSRGVARQGAQEFTVAAKVVDNGRRRQIGVGGGGAGTIARIDGEPAASLAELATILPVQVIDPGVHELIEGGPDHRRRFLDWGVFHVEPVFLQAWRRYRRVLRQRNAVLKHDPGEAALRPWDEQLTTAGVQVDAARRAYMASFLPELRDRAEEIADFELAAEYRSGWPAGKSLAEALAQSLDRDRETGVTQVGPHRGDVVFRRLDRRLASRVSRGQQKLAAAALVIAQTALFCRHAGRRCVLLVDDPAAELDKAGRARLLGAIEGLDCQLFLTALETESVTPNGPHRLFHVEQGRFSRVV